MEDNLVSFGNYLLDRYGVMVHSSDGKNQPIYQRSVTDADLSNWKHENDFDNPDKPSKTILPSRFQIGNQVKVFLMPEGEDSFPGFNAQVIAVHFYPSKVKYDLEVRFYGDYVTRIYNVDSILVSE